MEKCDEAKTELRQASPQCDICGGTGYYRRPYRSSFESCECVLVKSASAENTEIKLDS